MQSQLSLALAFFQALLVLGLGLAWFLALWQWFIGTTKQPTHVAAYESWVGVFSVVTRAAFGFGLLALVLVAISWSSLFERTGNVLGPILLVMAVIAFLTKTTVFRVMVHARGRVSEAVYSFCTLGTAFGYTAIVAGLIVMDAWLRDPTGASLIDGRFQVIETRAIFLNKQVGWQSLLTALGTILATVGWIVGRQGFASANSAPAAQALWVPTAVYRWLCGLALVTILITLFVIDFAMSRLVLDLRSLTDLLNANLLVERMGLSAATTMAATAKTVLVMMLLYSLLIALAWLYGEGTLDGQRLRRRLAAGLTVLGPGLWFGLWMLLYLSKGREVVVGRLTLADLVSAPSVTVLWVSAFLLGLATVATVTALWRSLSDSVEPMRQSSSPGALS